MAFYTEVDASKKFRLGTRVKYQSNEYIYLTGVASTVNGDWVCFDEAHLTTRMLAATIGRVAIANAAVDATTEFGWYTIYGIESGLALTAFADNGVVQATSTAGSIDDASLAAAENQVFGAWGRSAVNETTLLATFELSYPYKASATLD